MTGFADGVRVGNVPPWGPGAVQPGVPQPALTFYSVVPVASVINSLAVGQTLSGTAAAFTLQAGTGLTTTSINGTTYYAFDCERCVLVTGATSGVLGVRVSVTGLDDYKQPLTSTFSGPTGSGAGTVSPKSFRYISGATVSGNSVSGLQLGQADTIGFPYKVRSADEVQISYSGTPVTAAGSITVADTTAPSGTTGPIRGTFALSPAANAIRRFTAMIYVADPDTISGTYGGVQA